MNHTRTTFARYALAMLATFGSASLTSAQDATVNPIISNLRAADADQDGRLSRAEVAGIPNLAKHFDLIDVDRDGALSRDELRAAHQQAKGQRVERFGAMRDMESDSHQGRISILQQADACIKAATTREAYRLCEQQEQAARVDLRKTQQARREAMRTEGR